MVRALAPSSGILVTLALLAGCHSCAGIADLEVGAGGGGGAGTAGTAGSTTSTSTGDGSATSATTTGDPSSSATSTSTDATTGSSTTSTASGGVPCDGGTCEPGEFCEVQDTPGAGQEENCRECGLVPPTPPVDQCPPFCTNDCADDTCVADCAVETQHCGGEIPFEIFLDPKLTHMTLLCPSDGIPCSSVTVTCLGPANDEGTGKHDCHVVCDGFGACGGMHLDCSNHSGRCILECVNGGCTGATVTCGSNECIACGEGSDAIGPAPNGTCRVSKAPTCGAFF